MDEDSFTSAVASAVSALEVSKRKGQGHFGGSQSHMALDISLTTEAFFIVIFFIKVQFFCSFLKCNF